MVLLLGSHLPTWAANTIVPGIAANTTTPIAGSTLTLTLSYANNFTSGNNRTATIVRNNTITGLPTGLTGVTFAGLGAAGAAYNSGSGTISFNTNANGYDNSLTANDPTPDLNFTISFPVPAGMGAFTATSAPTTGTQSTTVNPQSVSVTIAPLLPADVSVTVSAPTTVPAGSKATITPIATNTSTTNTATNVVMVVQLATALAASEVSTSDDGTYNPADGKVTFPAISLAPGATFAPVIRLLMPASGTRTAKASATSTLDLNAANSDGTAAAANATITVTQIADVAISVSGPTTATAGASILYSVLLTNQGPSPATGLTAQLVLGGVPTNVVLSGGGTLAGSTVNFTVPGSTLAAGSSLIYTIRLTVPATGPVTGTASAASTTANGDPVAANNNGTAPASQVSTAVVASTPSEVCANPGASGSLVYSGAQGINTYYPGLTGTGSQNQAGQKVLAIGTAITSGTTPISGALAVGDLVVVIQMQGAPINTTNTSSYGDGYAGDPGSGAQGGSTFTAGQYEYGVVAALGTGTVTLVSDLTNAYLNANATATAGQQRFQVIRVPQYQNLTLNSDLTTTPAWNGTTGGVLILDVAGTLSLGTNRVINLVGKGFRGGGGRQLFGQTGYSSTDYRTPGTAALNASKGEGIAGTPRYLNTNGTTATDLGTAFGYPDGSTIGGGDNGRGAPGNAGGGGTDANTNNNDQNTGGGGGSNGGVGGQGGNSWFSNQPVGGFGGAPFLQAAPSRLVLGGGGGAGTTNNGTVADEAAFPANANLTNDGFASSGAAGGGIVVARAANVTGTGTINVSGSDMAFVPENDGSGGGGAGGSVLLVSNNTAANALTGVTILANGGLGGSNTGGGSAHGPGGGGSGGVSFASSAVNAASSYAAGTNGTTANGLVYEAGPGTSSAAYVRNNVGFDETPLLQAGANCVADVTTTLSGPTTIAAGGNSGPYTVTFTNNGLGTATVVARTLTLPVGASLSPAQLAAITALGGGYTTSTRGINFGNVASVASGAISSFAFSFTAPTATGSISLASGTGTTANQGADLAANTATLGLTVANPLTGYVFEDVNYGGGLGRSRATLAAAIGRPGVRVELYTTAGAFVAAVLTDANGQYALPVAASTGYVVRVVNNSVTSSRPGATFTGDATTGFVSEQLGVQTYNGTTDRVGGEYPNRPDATANLSGATLASLTAGPLAAQSIRAQTSAASGTTTGPDFGFNFDLVVNTADAGQGSLRQFILNSNALTGETALAQTGSTRAATLAAASTALPAGVETSIFMIPNGSAVAGQQAGLVSGFATTTTGNAAATILLTSAALPAITGAFTALDGGTQTAATGNSNGYSLATTNAETTDPEVIIDLGYRSSSAAGLGALAVDANDVRLLNLGIANSASAGEGVIIRSNALRTAITNSTVNDNDANIAFDGSGTANAATISYNIIRNARGANNDGIELNGGNNNLTISYNQILRNAGNGIDYINGSSAGNSITYNTIAGNGTAGGGQGQLSGVALRSGGSNGNTISFNTFGNNSGAGIIVVGGSTSNIFSQNTFSANGLNTTNTGAAYTAPAGRGLAIDLTATTDKNTGANGDGVTINDSGDGDTGGNGLLNFPVITSATVVGTNLVVQGFTLPGAVLEFYNPGATADPSGFGEGQAYLSTFTEGSGADTNGTTGSYGPAAINGLSQGTDNTNRFTFTIPIAGSFGGYAAGALLSATATLGGNTSEFAGNVMVNAAPIAQNVTNAVLDNTSGPVVLTPGLGGTVFGAGNAVASFTLASLPGSGTLTYDGTVLTASNLVSTLITNGALLTYAPVSGFVGNATFTYTVTDANGIASTTSRTGTGAASAGPAIYTIPVAAVADVTTTLSGPTQVIPGSANSYTVIYTNNGPNPASSVIRTVTVPAGSSFTTAQTNAISTQGGSVVGNLITYPPLTSLAAGAGNATAFTFAFTAPSAIGSTFVLISNVGTSTSQGTGGAADVATLSLTTAGAGLACNSVFYRVRQVGSTSILEQLDRTTSGGTVTYTGTTLYDAGVALNSLAFNYADGYLYAFAVSSNTLYRLSSTGAQNLGAISSLPAGANAATSDLSGNMYLADNSTTTLRKLNLSTLAVSSITLNQAVNFGDMAFNPLDNNIYATRYLNSTIASNGVARLNLITGAVTVLGTPATTGEDVGSMFFDAGGSLYLATNQGKFVYVNPATGAATLVGTAGAASQSDGASCVFATNSVDVVLSAGTPVKIGAVAYDVTYTARVKNTGAVSNPNVQVSSFLNDGSSPTGAAFPGASSVVVTTAPAVTAGTALALNSGYNGTTSPGLLAGTTALAANASSTITYTIRITYPSRTAIPTTPQSTSVYASTTSTGPNAGYALTSGAVVPPAALMAGDASTSGSTPPTSPNADAAAPTSVIFSYPLPVELTEFTAKAVSNADGLLQWTTASEKNNDYFDVERSLTGRDFVSIGQVQDQGSKASATAYQFTDAGIGRQASGLVYYRLRQVDTDGTATYSPVRSVAFTKSLAPTIGLYPNPTTAVTTLDLSQLPTGTYQVQVLDATGRVVLNTRLAAGLPHPLAVSPVASGTYTVLVRGTGADGTFVTLTKRLIKQ